MTNSEKSIFPVADTIANGERYKPLTLGLTKREYFAGLALQGILSSNEFAHIPSACSRAITLADELLKQLSE